MVSGADDGEAGKECAAPRGVAGGGAVVEVHVEGFGDLEGDVAVADEHALSVGFKEA